MQVGRFGSRQEAAAPEHRMAPSQRDQLFRVLEQVGVDVGPIEPTDVVVLAVGVVVALLGTPELIAAEQQRHPEGEQQSGEHGSRLSCPQRENVRIGTWPFRSTVPRSVVAGTVAVVLAIGLVVFVVVGHEITQGETVVDRDEVDRRGGPSVAGAVEIGRTGVSRRELTDADRVAAPEVAHRVAVLTVPFSPQRRKAAEVVTVGLPDVPRLGVELGARHDGILRDHVQEGGHLVERAVLPGERWREVETKAVDVHLAHPVAQ